MPQITVKDALGVNQTAALVTNTGAADPANSLPIVMANDVTVTGPAAQSVLNTDLLSGNVNGWYDCGPYQSASIQIVASAGITAGAVFFEQTNDTTLAPSGVAVRAYEAALINANPNVAAVTIAASTARIFNIPINARFIRVRISTAFVGGTVQAIGTFSQRPASYPTINVQQAVAGNFLTTVSGTVTANIGTGSIAAGTNAIGDIGLQYRANATGAASIRHIVSAATTNATSVKAAAGRIVGWNLSNNSASWRYVKLHNTAAAPTAGTGVVQTIAIPPNGLNVETIDGGIAFSTGIGFTTVTGAADTDATAVGANEIVGDLFFA